MRSLKNELMDILACPICKYHPLALDIFQRLNTEISEGTIFCSNCLRWYPIIDEIPHMLPDDLRNRKEDISFLKKWKKQVSSTILEKGKPFNLSK